ncbi:DUF3180 domain-containing protein [Cellulomonas sp. P22]|uniref:DUF3180 domain-containing protein n=1 Tax=Cellulomonas sp. P22 TaxID=3373189 RepID=UPI0037961853
MQRTRWQTLVLVMLATAGAGWLLLLALENRRITPPQVPWLVMVVEIVIAGVVFAMGWAVRQFLHGKRPTLDPIRAARTAVLAKASCYTGALLTGWYLAQVLLVSGDLDVASQRGRAGAAALAALGGLVLAVVGLVVEWFCRVPPQDGEDVARRSDPSPGPAAT